MSPRFAFVSTAIAAILAYGVFSLVGVERQAEPEDFPQSGTASNAFGGPPVMNRGDLGFRRRRWQADDFGDQRRQRHRH